MSLPTLNLARRPFANTRPVFRMTVAFWVVGGLLALGNLVLYGRSLAGLDDLEGRIAAADTAMKEERSRVAAAEQALRGLDLRDQNELALFLNGRIEGRTFPWSRLFDHLAEVLPRDVRLHDLSPRRAEAASTEGRSRSSRVVETTPEPERVGLTMTGQAQDDASLLELLDNLFASDRFVDPSLSSETRSPDNTIRFQLTVTYLPAGPYPTATPRLAGVPPEAAPSSSAPAADGTGGRGSGSAPPVPLRPAASRSGGGR